MRFDSEGQLLVDIVVKRVGAVAVEGDGIAVKLLLARHAHLARDYIIDTHLPPKRSGRGYGWTAANRVLTFIRQVEHGSVGEILREEIRRLGSVMSVKLTKSSGVFAKRRLRSVDKVWLW